jgi:hypothetical protein
LSFFVVALEALTAQSFVSTAVENKNVVLEYFTGIANSFDPSGHAIVDQIKTANPNDVFLINIPSGTFTQLNGNPDFTTTVGDAINAEADILGYPAGQVNRTIFGGYQQTNGSGATTSSTAQQRGTWATTSSLLLAEVSPVNVAAEVEIDLTSRELTVNVEAYYTSDAPSGANKLHIALLQNNLESSQTGATDNPSAILSNGNYQHKNMLRDMITPVTGENISTTTSGSLYTNSYTYSVPGDINGINVDLSDLEIVVFVSGDSYRDVYSGNAASISYIGPPGVTPVSVSLQDTSVANTSYCEYSITPEVLITNTGTTVVDFMDVKANYNGAIAVQQINGLVAGASQTITFPSISLSSPTSNIEFTATTEGYPTQLMISGDEVITTDSYYSLSATAFATTYLEDFESYSDGDRQIDNGFVLNPDNVQVQCGKFNNLGGYANSDGSFYWDFFSIQANTSPSYLIFDTLDFSSFSSAQVIFDYAHAEYNANTNDRLDLVVSTDCAVTWTSIWNASGSDLATVPSLTSFWYPQAASDWANAIVDVSAYAGQNNLVFALKGTSDYGNSLFVDNVKFENSSVLSVNNFEQTKSLIYYPNPVNDKLVLKSQSIISNVIVSDILGHKVIEENVNGFTKAIDMTILQSGTYFINVFTESSSNVLKVLKN